MKILVLGLEGISAELLFTDERLKNFRNLMEYGSYGMLAGFSSSQELPAWANMFAGQSPDSFNADPTPFIWQQLANEGVNAFAIGPTYGEGKDLLIFPSTIGDDAITAAYETGTVLPSLENEKKLQEEIYALSRRQFEAARQLMADREWGYFHFAITGLELMQAAFWHYLDSTHPLYEPDTPFENYVPDYYVLLDNQLGEIFELLNEDTAVMVVSARSLSSESDEDQTGFFILAAANLPIAGEVDGAHVVDIVPTLLELSGYEIPSHMEGKSLLKSSSTEEALSADEEELLRERLSGLGYI